MTGPVTAAPPRTFAARYGRYVSAGARPEPGALAKLPAWWGRTHWVDVEVQTAVHAHRDLCREEHVDPDTAVRVARAHAAYADHATGRGCRPTNERLALDLRVSVRQIQRARRLLKRLQLMAETMRGRMFMTRAERLAAWRNGSSHRQLAAEFALLSLRRHPHRERRPVERVTPPRDSEGERVSYGYSGLSRGKPRRMSDAPRRTQGQSRRTRPVTPAQARAHRLIAGVQRAVPWLSGVSPRRLTSLHRFAAQGWTERDVQAALADVLRARSWTVPEPIAQPAAYLAGLLRHVDEHDRPGALVEAQLADERTRREWLYRVNFGTGEPECAHGMTLGHMPHPITGVLGCALCRHERTSDAGDQG